MKTNREKDPVKRIKPEDLDTELISREAEVILQNGGTFRGKITASSKYWIKMEINEKTVYLNKRFVMWIRPV